MFVKLRLIASMFYPLPHRPLSAIAAHRSSQRAAPNRGSYNATIAEDNGEVWVQFQFVH